MPTRCERRPAAGRRAGGAPRTGATPGRRPRRAAAARRARRARPRRSAARRSAAVAPAVELRKQDAQHRGLELVEARVVADLLVGDLVARAVEAQRPHALGDRVVVRGDRAAVAEAAEVLRREEREGRRRAERAGAASVARSSRPPARRPRATGTPSASISSTGATLPNRWTATTAFVRGVSAARTVSGRDAERVRVDVAEDRRRARRRDRLGARVERERRDDDLVARPRRRARAARSSAPRCRWPRRPRGRRRGTRRTRVSNASTSGPRM